MSYDDRSIFPRLKFDENNNEVRLQICKKNHDKDKLIILTDLDKDRKIFGEFKTKDYFKAE